MKVLIAFQAIHNDSNGAEISVGIVDVEGILRRQNGWRIVMGIVRLYILKKAVKIHRCRMYGTPVKVLWYPSKYHLKSWYASNYPYKINFPHQNLLGEEQFDSFGDVQIAFTPMTSWNF
jgi:hypothetical protein